MCFIPPQPPPARLPSCLWHILPEKVVPSICPCTRLNSFSEGKRKNMLFFIIIVTIVRCDTESLLFMFLFFCMYAEQVIHYTACESRESLQGIHPTPRFDARSSSVEPRVWFVRDTNVVFLFLFINLKKQMWTWLSRECVICSRTVSAGCWIFHTGPVTQRL